MEKITIRNFGPITEAEIIIKDINVFIGTTSSGKSTAAKLIAIFQSAPALREKMNPEEFTYLLAEYNIDFAITKDTKIFYQRGDESFELSNNNIRNNFISHTPHSNLPIYVPAERVFFATISQSIFGLISGNISLPKWLIDFGARFEQARSSLKNFSVDFLQAKYEYNDRTDFVQLQNEVKIRLAQASSGLQSVIPMILVIAYNTDNKKSLRELFVIEEPELNLYPLSQKELMEFIIQRINLEQDRLIITTHSPYLLTTLDNLIQAKTIADQKPFLRNEISALVPAASWLAFERISCYYFNEGSCRSTLDPEISSIGPSNIDDVSVALSQTFETLLSLKYS